MVTQLRAVKKQAPTENEQAFLDLEKRIRAKTLKGPQEITVNGKLGEWAKRLYAAQNDEDRNALLQTALKDNPRLKSLYEAAKDVPPAPDESPVAERSYQLHPLSFFKNIPKREWGVENLLRDRGTSVWAGDGGSGKSALVLDMMLCRAYGLEFAGRNVKQGFIVWVAAESVDEIYPRVRGWMIHHNIPEEDEPPIWFLDERVPFNNMAEVDLFIESIKAQAKEMNVTVNGFVFDTYARCTPGANENDTQETKMIVDSISRISKDFNTHVAIIHHTNTQGKIRGSSVLKDDVDTAWSVTKESGVLKMHCEKMRGSLEPPDFSLQMISQILDDNNIDDTAPVVIANDEETPSGVSTSRTQINMLDILAASGHLSSNTWAQQCEKAHQISYSTFNNNRKELAKSGLIDILGEKVKGKKVTYFVTEAGAELLN